MHEIRRIEYGADTREGAVDLKAPFGGLTVDLLFVLMAENDMRGSFIAEASEVLPDHLAGAFDASVGKGVEAEHTDARRAENVGKLYNALEVIHMGCEIVLQMKLADGGTHRPDGKPLVVESLA